PPACAARGGQSADLALRAVAGRPAQYIAAGGGGDELAGPRSAAARGHPGPRLLPRPGPRARLDTVAPGRQPARGRAPARRRPADPGGGEMIRRAGLRLALAALAAVHLAALGAGFLAPYGPTDQNRSLPYAPPARLRFVDG